MKDKITVSCNKYTTDVDVTDNWDDVKNEVLGAAHRVLLANDRERGVIDVKNNVTEIIENVKEVLEGLRVDCGDCKWNGKLDTSECVDGEEGYSHCDDCHRKAMNYSPDIDKIIKEKYGKYVL